MKIIKSKLAIPILVALISGPICATATPLLGDPPSLPVKNCTWCHGTSAQGYSSAPRLAGQRPRYIENQLVDFRNHSRDNPNSRQFMWPATANLDPVVARNLADYFSHLPADAAKDGNRDLVAAGRAIYELGIPEANVVSCLVCHGPDAEGVREIPRLGGLSFSYLKSRLEQWGAGFHASAAPMPAIAQALSAQEIDALASYLSFVDYGPDVSSATPAGAR